MARRKGTSRVGGGGPERARTRVEPDRYPSLRERRPVMYWTVVIASLAMVLTLIIPFFTAFL